LVFFEERAIIRNFVMMRTITIHPVDMGEETAIRLFLEALRISYSVGGKDADENEYLLASLSMKQRLDKMPLHEKNGKDIKIPLDDIISFRSYIGPQKKCMF
jgi:hypothetical protein